MTKIYSVASARARLAEIVDEVEAGVEVEITRRGKKVAVVLSSDRFARLKGHRVSFAEAYEKFRREHDPEQNGVEATWASELRDENPGRKVGW